MVEESVSDQKYTSSNHFLVQLTEIFLFAFPNDFLSYVVARDHPVFHIAVKKTLEFIVVVDEILFIEMLVKDIFETDP